MARGIKTFKIDKNKFNNLNEKIVIKKKLSQKKYVNFLNKIDVGIVSLNDRIKSVNFPGRLFSYLMANKPIILLSRKDNELTRYIENNEIGIRMSSFKINNKEVKKIDNLLKTAPNKSKIFNLLNKNHSVVKISNQLENRL